MNIIFKSAAVALCLGTSALAWAQAETETAPAATEEAAMADNVIRVVPGENAQEDIQEALILAEPGSVIELGAGIYNLTGALSLDVPNITLRGAGMDQTILSFKGQTTGSEGLLVTAGGAWIENLAIEDTPGDGIKAKGVDQITFKDVRVEWTRGPNAENGAYGLYPVESKNVLIDGAVVRGASDAGIYVGQSQQIIVRNSRAEFNVAGIEIENCYFADVYDNVATRNTGGILIFDMPNLPQKGGHSIRIYNNKSFANDTANFAPPGNVVGSVPRGTGLIVMANHDVEVYDNEFYDNASINVSVNAYQRDYNDPEFDPLPRNIYIHDNTYGRAGWDPDKAVKDLVAPLTGTPIPDIVWDGAVDGIWAAFFGADEGKGVYVKEAATVKVANLNVVRDMILPWDVSPTFELEEYQGTLPPRDAVKLPQDK
ncbi:parallel beta-helix domain-containing protein [Gimibacter soli]|uniref:Right-handed parallel beta-helix repeat-containing protein n=1 Tax=Gimibacter soli TaxID=3024400 RepID=A0AAE9XU86_9PROT|nr:parallel beta-helix domain-containing protein [Gimibacter soli]WCL54605.1 right-handed parallel beta-helix repeat-containing protein [Gimibacter soli]